MANFSIKIEGLDELRRALRLLPENIQKNQLAKATRQGAMVIRDEAKPRVPILQQPDPRRKAGVLRNAVRSTAGRRNGSVGTAYVYVRTLTKRMIAKFKKAQAAKGLKIQGAANPNDPFYWRFIEFGTSKLAARPFLRPAFEAKKVQAAERIKAALRQGIETEAAKVAGRTFR